MAKKTPVSTDALDHATVIIGSHTRHHWPSAAGHGWERTVRCEADLIEAVRRIAGGAQPPTKCGSCNGTLRGVFHDEMGVHLLELRCNECGASFWPLGGDGAIGGTMKAAPSFDDAAFEHRRADGERRWRAAMKAAQDIHNGRTS
jgi:hypothetical protein